MFDRFRSRLHHWLRRCGILPARGPIGTVNRIEKEPTSETAEVVQYLDSHPVPYDENLLEKARLQWQAGDWDNLANLDRLSLQHHPDRAKLALLAASAYVEKNDLSAAQQFLRSAQDWGCSRRLISQLLIASVHNTLGRAATISAKTESALKHFESAIAIGAPGTDATALLQIRFSEQYERIRVPPHTTEAFANGLSPHQSSLPKKPTSSSIENLPRPGGIQTPPSVEPTASIPNPYIHNRLLTPELNEALRLFAKNVLSSGDLGTTYLDYLATKVIQIERNCVGRLATTVQDAIARLLTAEQVTGDEICILEIGALYGVSLAILYNHGVTRFRRTRIVCLDPFDGYYGKAFDAVLNQPVNELTFARNMKLANVPDQDYCLIKNYSTDQAAIEAAMQTDFNLLVIDGDHSYDGIKFDFETYFPMLATNGYVIFDDYACKEWPEVRRFVDGELREYPDFEYLGSISRTAVGRKRESKGS